MSDESFYRDSGNAAARTGTRLHELEQQLQEAYGRWEELETLREEYSKIKRTKD
jgi:hypothetical protein